MSYKKECLVTFYKKGGEILAYWPHVKMCENKRTSFNQSYARIGQHSPCSPAYIRGARLATMPEYMPLLLKLISVGYNDLQVCNISRKLPSEYTDIGKITRSYVECLFLVNEEQLNIKSGARESAKLQYLVKAFAMLFNSKFGRSLEGILKSEQIGHSMYLTQHRHGAGFVDFSEIPDELEQEISDFLYSFGELNPYIKNKILCVDSRW